MAVKVMVELFRLVKHRKELHREISPFLIPHDHLTVIICGHYPVIDGNKTTTYRHPIYEFGFTALDGRTPCKFSTTSVNTSSHKQPQQLSNCLHIVFAIAIIKLSISITAISSSSQFSKPSSLRVVYLSTRTIFEPNLLRRSVRQTSL
jgi:hypothetical protein